MLDILKQIWSWFIGLFNMQWSSRSRKPNLKKKEIPLYLPCNGRYMEWIESLERQINQVKIDYYLGSISKRVYDEHFEALQKEVKQLSLSYAKELLSYSS